LRQRFAVLSIGYGNPELPQADMLQIVKVLNDVKLEAAA
jgi:hypothetical protein